MTDYWVGWVIGITSGVVWGWCLRGLWWSFRRPREREGL